MTTKRKTQQLSLLSVPITNLFAPRKAWESLNGSHREQYVDDLVTHYQEQGFPYFNLDKDTIYQEMTALKAVDSRQLVEDNRIKQIMLGLNVVNHFMPNIFHAKNKAFRSPVDCFSDKGLLKKAIEKRLELGDNMSDAGMRKALSFTSGTHRVSNFRPTVAKYIYDMYAGSGLVIDFSSGYGGRLLGALASQRVRKYIGCEPNTETYQNLKKMAGFFSGTEIELINECAEDVSLGGGADLVFSSPPYFNTEEYCNEDTQSYLRFPTKDQWKDGFLRQVIRKSVGWLKPNGYLIINIANVDTYKNLESDTLDLATEYGFVLERTYLMELSGLFKSEYKHEPVFVFRRNEFPQRRN